MNCKHVFFLTSWDFGVDSWWCSFSVGFFSLESVLCTWGLEVIPRLKRHTALRLMGSENWWFGDPKTMLYTSQPLYSRVQWFSGWRVWLWNSYVGMLNDSPIYMSHKMGDVTIGSIRSLYSISSLLLCSCLQPQKIPEPFFSMFFRLLATVSCVILLIRGTHKLNLPAPKIVKNVTV